LVCTDDLDLLASGLSYREIVKRLVVSDETAHTSTKQAFAGTTQ